MDDTKIELVRELRDRLPNLQLLEGTENIQKQATLPMEWLRDRYPSSDGKGDEKAIKDYCDRHNLGQLPEELKNFQEFYDMRYTTLKSRITNLINKS